MPPEPGTTPITPSPARTTMGSKKSNKATWWGSVLLLLIVATFAGSAFFNNWNARMTGTVSIIVRDAVAGTRSMHTFDLGSSSLAPLTTVDANTITTLSARTFTLSDGSIVTLENAGIVRKSTAGIVNVLIASPVPPVLRTPLSVVDDADRIAWVSPADGSIQVFDRSERGTYAPVYLNAALHPNSLGFSSDGAYLVATVIAPDQKTDVYIITLDGGVVTRAATIDGLAFITQTP